jgi:O-methyltransferase/aklanonic acid methyltransferase
MNAQGEIVMSDAAHTHKELVAGFFGRAAASCDGMGPHAFTYFGRRLVELAQIPWGAQVLDVATGRGAVLFPAAEHVGPHGHVVGIDVTEPMVQLTAAEISQRKVTNAEVRQMDAEHLVFPDARFDCVLCGFGLMFFPDLQRALAEFRRVLRLSGRVAVTTRGEEDEPEKRFSELVRAYRFDVRLGLHALQTPAALKEVLQQAGLTDIQVTGEEVDFVYADEEEWWAMMRSGGPGASLERMPSDTLERFKTDALLCCKHSSIPMVCTIPAGSCTRLQWHLVEQRALCGDVGDYRKGKFA